MCATCMFTSVYGGPAAAFGLIRGPLRPCRKGATKTLRQKLGGRVGLEGESETVSGASPHCSLLPTFCSRGIISESSSSSSSHGLLSWRTPSLSPETQCPYLNPNSPLVAASRVGLTYSLFFSLFYSHVSLLFPDVPITVVSVCVCVCVDVSMDSDWGSWVS